MSAAFEEYQRKRDKEIRKTTLRVAKMISKGFDVEEISQKTGVPINEVKEIEKDYKEE